MQLHRSCTTTAIAAPLLLVIAVGVTPPAHAQAASPPLAKQLAGPPAEFAAMRPPDPAATAINSRSALIPIELRGDKSGNAQWHGTLPSESGRLRFVVFSGGADWNATLTTPSGAHAKADPVRELGSLGLGDTRIPVQRFDIDSGEIGEWSLSLRGTPAKAGAPRHGFVLLEGDPSTELASWRGTTDQRVGSSIAIAAVLTATPGEHRIDVGEPAGRIALATLEVTAPDGSTQRRRMVDDGRHGDGHAGDGVYGASFDAAQPGQHVAQVTVRALDRDGNVLVRTAEHIVPVVGRSLHITGAEARGVPNGDGRIRIGVPVMVDAARSHYRAYAEVWGQGADGVALPVAWVGGMVMPQKGTLGLELDARWIARAGAQAPFELRNLRVEDADVYATVADADRLSLSLPPVDAKSFGDVSIDESMRMGPRPEGLQAKGVGSRLLLVHGYCSGGVWPASQFSNDSTFLDANQNRSHDQFARLIRDFGNTWNSFGIVAHSQGGAAALHLYTYYWSGLDYASGNRLIQSVGTPYQGTNLAGILAAVGSWFGVGCGTNNDLSYGGASAWLAGIPSWARGKVNYYTTAFRTTNWWTNDYCNFASDLVLSDPEDGTTERAWGQLPYGINRGHTSGQCHTTGMRDPAQYLDSNRNAVMNSNAAR